MSQEPLSSKLKGVIESDETYNGGKVKGKGCYAGRQDKAPVVALVKRNGKARSFHFESVTAKNLRLVVKEHIAKGACLMTDDSGLYNSIKGHFSSHDLVTHSAGEYVRREGEKVVHTSTLEGFFSILKRGIFETYHHVGNPHLHRYLSEFYFRYNAREVTDAERTSVAIEGVTGKRLKCRDSCGRA